MYWIKKRNWMCFFTITNLNILHLFNCHNLEWKSVNKKETIWKSVNFTVFELIWWIGLEKKFTWIFKRVGSAKHKKWLNQILRRPKEKWKWLCKKYKNLYVMFKLAYLLHLLQTWSYFYRILPIFCT